MRIPAKPNAVSEGKPNGIPGRTRTPSELSDAGHSILQEVFGFVREKLSGAQRRKRAGASKGARGKLGTPVPTSAHSGPERDQLSG
jgi:hypothetical protein